MVSQGAQPSQAEFFGNAPEGRKYRLLEIIGKGSYGLVASAIDLQTQQRVAIKKIINVFDHVSDSTRILREIKLLRLLKHPDIVEIKHILLPEGEKRFKDIFVVFELMETDLHQVIKANDDLSPDHHQFFLYQLLRGLKFVHSAKVFHRDLKPKNILANSDCKLKICDFGLARPALDPNPYHTIYWTDYVATRWYRAPELCGSFFARYSPAIDIWSVGCIFAEILLGKPLFPGRNVVQQLELITDLLGKPAPEVIAKVRNEKAKRFLTNMRDKQSISFSRQFQGADPKALSLLKRMLAFDPQERPSAVEALRDEYFAGLANEAREPSATPISSYAFQFESRKLELHDVRRLIYEEILEFHPLEKDRYREVRLLEQQRSMEYHRPPNSVPGFEYVDRNIPSQGGARSNYPVYRQGGSQGQVHSSGSSMPGYNHTVSAAVDSMRNMQVSQTSNGADKQWSGSAPAHGRMGH